ncbi:MAG: triose-phosphate isomerase [Pseudomonadales bacterium]|nr:triose-phosphate isomerase [Pseudomonadales bacterium]
MRKSLVVGNWKMNGDQALLGSLIPSLVEAGFSSEVVICPSFVHLHRVAQLIEASDLILGAQNLDWHESGAYTGEISSGMLKEVGCKFVIVGHSERRTSYGDTDEIVAKKFEACLDSGLTPILCLGETQAQRQAGETTNVVESQLQRVFDSVATEKLDNSIIAYEPIWAIGTGETASPEEAESVHATLRKVLAERSGQLAAKTRILYGGSVNENNAEALFSMENIDGALVGGASLKAEAFVEICHIAGRNS